MKARGPIHAMLPDCGSPAEAEAREAELDRRLDAYRAEVRAETLAEAVAEAEQTARGFSTDTDWGSAAVGALQGLVYRLRQLAGQPPSATGAGREAAIRADERARVADRIQTAADSAYGRFHPVYVEGLRASARLAAESEADR